MNCPHCNTDHQAVKADWPESWTQARRLEFAKRLMCLGVVLAYVPTMAAEVQKLICQSPYLVTEEDLFRYLDESNKIVVKINAIERSRDACLSWTKPITNLFKFKINDNKAMVIIKILLLVIIGAPLFVLTVPIRLPFAVAKFLVKRKLHTFFTGWLAKNGKLKG